MARHRILWVGMTSNAGNLNAAALVRATAIFRGLTDDQIAAVWSQAKVVNLIRGDVLFRQNLPSDAVYIVLSGRFEVWIEGRNQAISEIGVGELIGETGFFSGAARNATLIAARDSVVLALDRQSFERVAREVPAIYQSLLGALARRLVDTSSRRPTESRVGVARTIAIVAGDSAPLPASFMERFGRVIVAGGKGLLLTQDLIRDRFPNRALDDSDVLNWLNAQTGRPGPHRVRRRYAAWSQCDRDIRIHYTSARAPPPRPAAPAPHRMGYGHCSLAARTRSGNASPRRT